MLAAEEVKFFHDEGYLGPFELCSQQDMDAKRAYLEAHILGGSASEFSGSATKSRHLDDPVIYQLCTSAGILERISSILGPDLLLWQSNFFNKVPGTKQYPWHQDAHFWANTIEPPVNVSAWIAIDDSTVENGCVELLAGSHKTLYPHIASTDAAPNFREAADLNFVDLQEDKVVSMQMRAGQFFLFNERMLHRSSANTSSARRLGLAARLISPITRCYKSHPVLLVKGQDRMGFNKLGQAPS